MLYRINWYVNGTLHAQLGPSRNQDELVLKAETFSSNGHTYEVQCGVITIVGNDENELMSFVLRAGWMILDDSITLSKNEHAYVYVKQTIPIGCYYNDNEESNCEEELIIETESKDACTGRISVQNDKIPNESFMKIKSLKKGEQWTTIIHKARITTVDSNYDDATNFDLHVRVTNRSGQDKQIPVLSKDIGVIHVKVTNSDRHRNKRCYSHVDPHMRTVDGLYYEAQREGDYMLYRNKDYQTEAIKINRTCIEDN
ncbi:uncharacterized protein LOC132742889 [Ruditapes philippinarum]|uniref:uncharacterized protein LOC132742889 n=1 Tax=Ruditapes philippinarum TaxID=129788 RepID=UPI00295BAF73|nr:uncharacterized protein LOC132742889 [Ruditapes philippinarum]